MQAWGLPYENYISRPTSTTLVISTLVTPTPLRKSYGCFDHIVAIHGNQKLTSAGTWTNRQVSLCATCKGRPTRRTYAAELLSLALST